MLNYIFQKIQKIVEILYILYLGTYIRPIGYIFFLIFTLILLFIPVLIYINVLSSQSDNNKTKIFTKWLNLVTTRHGIIKWFDSSLIAKTLIIVMFYNIVWLVLYYLDYFNFFYIIPIIILITVFSSVSIHTAVAQFSSIIGCIFVAFYFNNLQSIQDLGWLMFFTFFLSIIVSSLFKGRILYSFSGFVLNAKHKENIDIITFVNKLEYLLKEIKMVNLHMDDEKSIIINNNEIVNCNLLINNEFKGKSINPFFKSVLFKLHQEKNYLPGIFTFESNDEIIPSAVFDAIMTTNVTTILKSKMLMFEDSLKIIVAGIEQTSTKLYVSKRSHDQLVKYQKALIDLLNSFGFDLNNSNEICTYYYIYRPYTELGELRRDEYSFSISKKSEYGRKYIKEIYSELLAETFLDKVRNNILFRLAITFISGIVSNVITNMIGVF